jgi:SAM-dependent methyltransferase
MSEEMKDDKEVMRQFDSREEEYWLYAGRLEILRKLFAEFIPSGSLVLNVGCGPGGTSLCAMKRGGPVVSLDYSLDALSYTRTRGADLLVRGDSTRLPVGSGKVDVALCLDVLEHLEDDRAAAAELRRVLDPGWGRLLVTVPANRWQWTSRDKVFGHYRRYSTRSLRQLLEGGGFRVLRLTHFNSLLFPLALVDLLLDRFRRPLSAESCYPSFSGLVNSAFTRIFTLEKNFVPSPGFPFGKSLFCLARPV